MVEITQDWVYVREACDCCDGWHDEVWSLQIDGDLVGEYSSKVEAQAAYLEHLNPEVLYYESPYPEDEGDEEDWE